jgi:signal transduction histidine kinase
VKLELDLKQGEVSSVCVARRQIESALLNILDNAIDASSSGGVVRIEAETSDGDARPRIEISVRDFGRGIDPTAMQHIFDPFFTTKPAGEGTGLGLALARQFVEAHAGHLSVESRSGSGTTVRLSLPIETARSTERNDDSGS